MIFKTHMAFALNITIGLELANIIIIGNSYYEKVFFYSFLLLGSVFPDIDEPNSFIGKKFPIISDFLSFSFGHRGFTHFLIFPLLIFFGLYFFIDDECKPLLFAFCLGNLLHQVGDMLTNTGIKHYFYPLSDVSAVLLPRCLRFNTGMLFEKFVFLPLMVVVLIFLVVSSNV